MTLYRKHGGPPQPLFRVDRDAAGFPWTDLANNPAGLAACGWTLAPELPAHDPASEIPVWDPEAEAWRVDPLPPAPVEPVRIGKFWLFERFTEEQERRFAALEFAARNLTPTDLADPTKEGLFQLQRFLRRLDALNVVELDALGTIGGFELLRLLSVFGDPADPASSAAMAEVMRPPTGRELEQPA